MKRSSKALRMAQPLAVVAVWAGLLGYVIPAAFSATPTVSTTASASSAASRGAPGPLDGATGSSDRKAPRSASSQHRDPAMVRVMQAAPRAHGVCVTLGRQTLSCDQAFASITPYRSVRPGTWTVRATGRGVFLLGVLGWALAMAGRKEPARAVLEEFRARPESAPTVVSEAWLLAALGYKERAFRVLARAEQEYQPFILFPKLPGFDLLRADPRLPAMEVRLGLPPLAVTP